MQEADIPENPAPNDPGAAPFKFVCPFCIPVKGWEEAGPLRQHFRHKHANDQATRVRHHQYPCCLQVTLCTVCYSLFPTEQGRKAHVTRVHGRQQAAAEPEDHELDHPIEAHQHQAQAPTAQPHATQQPLGGGTGPQEVPYATVEEDIDWGVDPEDLQQDDLQSLDEQNTGNYIAGIVDPNEMPGAPPLNAVDNISDDTLLSTFNQGLFTLHYRWIKPMRVITTKLIGLINANDALSDKASTAFFLLPGLLKALSIIKLPTPAIFLKQCQQPANITVLPHFIISGATQVHKIMLNLREQSRRRGNPDHASRRRSEMFVLARHKRRMEALFKEGRYSTATRVLEQAHQSIQDPVGQENTPLPTVDEAKSILLALNPIASPDDILPAPSAEEGSEPFTFTSEDVQRCIRELPKGSANGASGWSYNVIHQLYAHPSEQADMHLNALVLLFNNLANGRLSNKKWVTSRAVLIPKPEQGKYRPIGIGEAWYRLLGRCILKQIGGDVGSHLTPLQMGCGISGGSEIAARMAQLFLDAHPNHVLIKTDFKNAFNLTPRKLILQGLQRYCPRLIPWFRWAYAEPTPLVDAQGRVVGSSQTGCRQGDPLAALLFCVAIQGSLIRVQELLQETYDHEAIESVEGTAEELQHPGSVLAYMDDCTIAVPATYANQIAEKLSDIFAAAGLVLNPQKCQFIGGLSSTIVEPVFSCFPEGDIVLGSPTGTQLYRGIQCEEMTDRMMESLPTLEKMDIDPLVAINLLRYCIIPRASYIARVQEYTLIQPALRRLDERVDAAIRNIVRHQPPPPGLVARHPPETSCIPIIRSLPLHWGGLGMQRFSWIAGQMACIRSRHLTRQFVDEHWANVEGFSSAMTQWSAMSIGDTPTIPDSSNQDPSQEDLRKQAEEAYLASAAALQRKLIEQNFQAHAAWFISSQFEGSGRWISPSIGVLCQPQLSLRGDEYREAMRSRLLLHPLENLIYNDPIIQCYCRRDPLSIHQMRSVGQNPSNAVLSNQEPYHYLDCVRAKGLMKGRHDEVVNSVLNFVKKRFPTAVIIREPKIDTPPGITEQVRADLSITLPDFLQRQFIIDVAIANPAAPSYRANSIKAYENPGAASEHRDKLKTKRYSKFSYPDITTCNPKKYYTFNVEATGRLGDAALSFIEELYRATDRSAELIAFQGPSPLTVLNREISSIIAKRNARAASFHKRKATAVC